VFFVNLDFGAAAFPGADRFLEISVRRNSSETYTVLAPRSKITSVPYAVKALNAATADDAASLGGTAADEFVQTDDERLSDARAPLPNSPSYIQNSLSPQAASNFNISGTGTANIFNVATQFNLGGNRILSSGSGNLFAGINAGANTTGGSNSFLGTNAGATNSGGQFNTFVGRDAGSSNSTESNNTFIGSSTNGASGVTNASAIGYRARVTTSNSLVLGSISGVNGATANTNVGIGTTAPSEKLHVVGNALFTGSLTANGSGLTNLNATNITSGVLAVARGGTGLGTPGSAGRYLRSNGASWTSSAILASDIPAGATTYIQNTTTQQASTNFSISGSGTVGGTLSGNVVSATTQFNIGGSRVLAVGSTDNLSIGIGAGPSTGTQNTFVGARAGRFNSTGSENSVFGVDAGSTMTSAQHNSMFGRSAGQSTTGNNNAFFGAFSGLVTTSGFNNAFIGTGAGTRNTTGSENTFVGDGAGVSSFNLSLSSNSIGSKNVYLGRNATGTFSLTNATAIGYRAFVTQSDSLVLGSVAGENAATASVNVGIGTTAPTERLHVNGNGLFTGNFTANGNGVVGGRLFVPTGSTSAPSMTFTGFSGTGISGSSVLNFSTGGSERMRLDANGNVGIGTSSPPEKLYVIGNGRFTGNFGILGAGSAGAPTLFFNLNDTNTGIYTSSFDTLNFSTSGISRVQIGSTGNVGIGTTSPSGKLHVLGDIRLTLLGGGAATHLCWNTSNQISFCSSSIRYKENINPFGSGLDLINRLRPVSFNWKEGGMLDFGLVAEEVAEVEPLLATYNTEGVIEGVKYDRVGVVAINAIKEQQAQIERQQQQIERQQEELSQQQSLIEGLRRLVCKNEPNSDICQDDR
jgi:hypothetical protein